MGNDHFAGVIAKGHAEIRLAVAGGQFLLGRHAARTVGFLAVDHFRKHADRHATTCAASKETSSSHQRKVLDSGGPRGTYRSRLGARNNSRPDLRAVIAVRMRRVPSPGGADDRLDVGVLRLPVEHVVGPWSRSATSSGGSPARRCPIWLGIACPVTRRQASITSRTLLPRPVPRLSCSEPGPMSSFSKAATCADAQVVDVDVVANAGAVGRGIVVAKNRDVRPLSQGHLQHDRNQVRLGVVVFAQIAGGPWHRRH